ncbi:hypothetical protein GE061_006291 [Apolygus lucorum]|uniref:Uncharacterized protein n=1 Tax=Apolygus lucorum TaxID=248454 RepID=A0A8S9WTB6_APOLU|nr:hypothetical protein GE061_006291 [Apolygus lucorum]
MEYSKQGVKDILSVGRRASSDPSVVNTFKGMLDLSTRTVEKFENTFEELSIFMAIGLVCCNIGAFVSVVIVGSIVLPSFHGRRSIDPSCSGLCDRGLDIIAHLFMGCSYEGIAINICTIPVLVWVLKEAVVFVKLDLQARNEKAVIKESPSTTDLHHPKRGMRQDSQRRVRFSTSGSSLLDSILPEVKFFKKLPDTPSRIQTNDDNDMREAVIQVMSEEWSHSGASRTVAPAVISYARSKHSSLDSPQEDEERGSADSASSVDPWSTTSSSASDRTKDF